jgi:hypothetical protein
VKISSNDFSEIFEQVGPAGVATVLLSEHVGLTALVDLFSLSMKTKLLKHLLAGKRGWDNPGFRPDGALKAALLGAINRENWVSVANFAAMLLNRDGS